MKHAILSALIALSAVPAAANTVEPKCLAKGVMYAILEETQSAKRVVSGGNGMTTSEFWINPNGSGWSLIIVSDSMACLVAAGRDWTLDAPYNAQTK